MLGFGQSGPAEEGAAEEAAEGTGWQESRRTGACTAQYLFSGLLAPSELLSSPRSAAGRAEGQAAPSLAAKPVEEQRVAADREMRVFVEEQLVAMKREVRGYIEDTVLQRFTDLDRCLDGVRAHLRATEERLAQQAKAAAQPVTNKPARTEAVAQRVVEDRLHGLERNLAATKADTALDLQRLRREISEEVTTVLHKDFAIDVYQVSHTLERLASEVTPRLDGLTRQQEEAKKSEEQLRGMVLALQERQPQSGAQHIALTVDPHSPMAQKANGGEAAGGGAAKGGHGTHGMASMEMVRLEERLAELESTAEHGRSSEDFSPRAAASMAAGLATATAAATDAGRRSSLTEEEQEELQTVRERLHNMEASFARWMHAGSAEDLSSNSEAMKTLEYTLQRIMRRSRCYKLQPSVWDAALFLMYRELDIVSNILLLLATIVNAIVQAATVSIVAYWIAVDSYSEDMPVLLSSWRASANATQVEQLCNQDPTLSTYTVQSDLFDTASTYLSFASHFNVQIGPMLCAIVVFMWTLKLTAILRLNVEFFVGCWVLASSKHMGDSTQLDVGRSSMKGSIVLKVAMLSRPRLVWGVVNGMVEFTVAAVLLYFGSMWLVYTKSLSDLILNALALIYVTDMDEIIYTVFVPSKVKVLIDRLEPFPLNSATEQDQHTAPRPFFAVGTLLFSFLFMLFIWRNFIVPHFDSVVAVHYALCNTSLADA